MSTKPIISKKVSKHLFLPNLKPKPIDNIDNLRLSLIDKIENKKTYFDSLEYKLKHIRKRNKIKEIEERKRRKK